MKINYQETPSDLAVRINIHDQFGGKNIDQWMLDVLHLQPGAEILDVGCGAGKQCFSFLDYLQGNAKITGGDVSQELLGKAQEENSKRGNPIHLGPLNFNEKFPFLDNTFDLVSCCFAIYYAEDVAFTIREMHRVLKPGGKLFTTGPMPQNKQLFYDIIKEATQKPIPPMPGSSRYESQFLPIIRSQFQQVEVHIFENPLTFTEAAPFVDYTKASLSEDRKLWTALFNGKEEFEALMRDIQHVAEKKLAQEGKLVMTKVVGGFLATR